MNSNSFDENQSQFLDEQALQANIASPVATGAPSATRKVTKPNTLVLLAAIGGGILILLTLMLLITPKNSHTQVKATPTATIEAFTVPTELEAKLQQLLVDITKADPERSILPLPPVSYDLMLKDLTQVR